MAQDGDKPGSDNRLLKDVHQAVQTLKARVDKPAATREQLEELVKKVGKLQEELTRLGSELRQSEQERTRQQKAARKGLLDAADRTASKQQDIKVISEVLRSGLPPRTPAFSDLRVAPKLQSFEPGRVGEPPPPPIPVPEPKPPRLGIFGGTGKYEQDM